MKDFLEKLNDYKKKKKKSLSFQKYDIFHFIKINFNSEKKF